VTHTLSKLEVYKDKTLQVVRAPSDVSNTLDVAITDYVYVATDGTDHQALAGSGNVLFADQSTAKTGMILNAANSWTGTTTINGTTQVILGNSQALGSTAQHTVELDATSAGAVLNVNGQTANVGSVKVLGGGAVNLASGGTLNIIPNTAAGKPVGTGGGTFSGANSLTGTGVMNVTYGTLNVLADASNTNVNVATNISTTATVVLNNVNGLGKGTTSGTITDNGMLNVTTGGTLDNLVAGTGTWQKSGTGDLVSNLNNTFAGNILVSGGTLTLNGSNASVKASELQNNTVLELGNSASAGTGAISLTGAAATIRALNNLTLGNPVNLVAATTGTIDTNGKLVSETGTISGANGKLAVVGAGTLSINHANSYGQGTTIDHSKVQLTAGGQAGLGSGTVAMVNTSQLELGFSNATFANVLTGAATETVQVTGSNVTLSPVPAATTNNGFLGTWDITGGANVSGPAASVMSNMGTSSLVYLDGASSILKVATTDAAAFTFANKMKGNGTLDATLQSATSQFSFNTAAVKAGGAFTGTLNMENGKYMFSTEDQTGVGVLQNATLTLSASGANVGSAEIDRNYTIGGLKMNGGSLQADFVNGNNTLKGMLNVGTLDPSGGGKLVANALISNSISNVTGTDNNFFADSGNANRYQLEVVKAGTVASLTQLTLVDISGSTIGNPQPRTITGTGGVVTGTAYYNYTATVGQRASDAEKGLFIGYGLSELHANAGQNVLVANGTVASALDAKLTGPGGFTITAGPAVANVGNAASNYTGTTAVTAGTVVMQTSNAFGTSAALNQSAGTKVDMNGMTQTVGSANVGSGAQLVVGNGQLTATSGVANGGTVSLNSGTLNDTGVYTGSAGSLLDINSGQANVGSAVNSGTIRLGSGTFNDAGAYTGSAGSMLNIGSGSALIAGVTTVNTGGSMSVGGGVLTMNGGGSISGADALKGTGVVNVGGASKLLTISGSNAGLLATVNIAATDTVQMDNYVGLGQLSTVNASGTLRIQNAAPGNLTNTVNLNNGGLEFVNTVGTQSGVLNGTGQVNLKNATVDVTGNNGTLSASSTFSIDASSTMTVHVPANVGAAAISDTGVLNLNYMDTSATWNLTNVLSGPGVINKNNDGEILIARANALTGPANINKGEITLTNLSGLGSGTATIANGGTLGLAAAGSYSNRVVNNGVLELENTSGTLTLASTVSGSGSNQVFNRAAALITGTNTGFTGLWDVQAGGVATAGKAENLGPAATRVNGTLNLASSGSYDWLYKNALSGTGLVNAKLNGGLLEFDPAAGTGFAGTVDLVSAAMNLEEGSANEAVLTSATLKVDDGGVVTLGTNNASIKGLVLNGGLFNVQMKSADEAWVLNVTDLKAASGASTTFALSTALTASGAQPGGNFIDQANADNGGVQIIASKALDQEGVQMNLTMDGVDAPTSSTLTVSDGFGNSDIEATYDYVAVSSSNGVNGAGIYADYLLTELKSNSALVLSTSGALNNTFGAKLTGSGSVEYQAEGGLTLVNGSNDYTGESIISSGTVISGVDNALGNTEKLTIADGAGFDLNGAAQTIGALEGALGSTLDLDGGLLTISGTDQNGNPSGSVSSGELKGSGNLIVESSTLEINGANTDLNADVDIQGPAQVTLHDVEGLGQSVVTLDGTLALDGASGTFANTIQSGTDSNGLMLIEGQSNVAISEAADNSAYSGSWQVDPYATLKVSNELALGSGEVNVLDSGTFLMGGHSDWTLNNTVNGAGEVIKTDGNTVTLGVPLNTTGELLVQSGTLKAGVVDAIMHNSSVQVDPGATLDLGGHNQTLGGNLVNNGVVDFGPESSSPFVSTTLTVDGGLSGNGTFAMNLSVAEQESDQLIVHGPASGDFTVQIKRTPEDMAATPAQLKVKMITIDDPQNIDFTANGAVDIGMRVAKLKRVGNEWLFVLPGIGSAGDTVLASAAASQYGAWNAMNSSLLQRMGAIHPEGLNPEDLSESHDWQLWSRGYGSVTNYGSKISGSPFRSEFYGMEVGADKAWVPAPGQIVMSGAYAGYGRTRMNDFASGPSFGTSNAYQAALYATWMQENGWYADLVGRGMMSDNQFNAFDQSMNRTSASYTNWAAGASLELGKQQKIGQNWYIEPQVQISYARFFGGNYRTGADNAFDVKMDAANMMQVRVGTTLGRTFIVQSGAAAGNSLQTYVKAFAVQTTSNGGKLHSDDMTFRPNTDGASLILGAGVTYRISPNTRFYLDYEAQFADKYTTPVRINLGVGFKF